ncbi:MAG: COX15/CtaA family protein, partial [Pirellulaceae bacterium]|nr:COX15/CtaA family protein [Pirellulaceae bacterium]
MLVCLTFPLIWVGGLVTTYDAGMAVPDWPTTYGYNLFAYPVATWIAGPFDLFIEHGHRLLGAVVGFVAILLVVAVWRNESRRWVRWFAVGALLLVIAQGLLGGARVLLDQRTLAMIHACVGPAFFAYAVSLCAFLSPNWRAAASEQPVGGRLRNLALLTAVLAFFQLLIGAQVRHVKVDASPHVFGMVVMFHIAVAIVLAGHIAVLAWTARRPPFVGVRAGGPAAVLFVLVLAQLILGGATWVVKWGWPGGLSMGYTVVANSFWQALIVTAHVAVGSLILGFAVLCAVRVMRGVRAESLVI